MHILVHGPVGHNTRTKYQYVCVVADEETNFQSRLEEEGIHEKILKVPHRPQHKHLSHLIAPHPTLPHWFEFCVLALCML